MLASEAQTETPEVEVAEVWEEDLLGIAPMLRSYALRTLRSKTSADDAVQDTLERAWSARHTFRPGADLKPWIFTILRNTITDSHRQSWRVVEDVDGVAASRLETQPDQLWRLHYADTIAAIEILGSNQKRALLLVAQGATTVEVAALMACPLGTLKSHLRLARRKLKRAGV